MLPEPNERDLPNIRHMHVFCIAEQYHSISVSAERMFITQPAASQAVAKLEKDLGVTLLIRGSKGLSTSNEGAIFANRARRSIRFLKMGVEAAQNAAGVDDRDQKLAQKLTSAQLRALTAIGIHGSYTVAARALGLAQPTIYRTAKSLEQSCGFEVFRSALGGIELTSAGQLLNRAAKLARSEIRQAYEELAALSGIGRITFTLGSMPLARSEIVPEAIGQMVTQEKALQVRVQEGRYADMLRELREGGLDCLIGALRDPAPADDVFEEPLFEDELAVIARPEHPLAARPYATLEDTLAYPWIASPMATPAGTYIFETLKIEERPQTPIRVVSSSLVLIRSLLQRDNFVTVISQQQFRSEIESGLLTKLPVALEGNRRKIGLTMRKNWVPTEAQIRFLATLKQAAHEATS